jgi:hydroxyacylglutathione hydrolase
MALSGENMIQFKNEHVTVFQSSLYQTTSTVVETNDLILIIDPTWLPHEVENIQNYVVRIQNGRPLYLLFTHSDWDHVLGYHAFPDAITIGSKEMDNHPEKESILNQILEFDQRYYLNRSYEITFPKLDVLIDHDGQQLTIGETQLTFYKAPGHTPDGLFTIVETLGIFIAGDYQQDLIQNMIDSYPYPEGMKHFHQDNCELIRKELESEG